MGLGRTITMGLLAGVAALSLGMPQAQARDGRNAALIGGLLLGATAGALIADSADQEGYDAPYRRHGWGRPAPRYEAYPAYQSDESFDPPPRPRPYRDYSYRYGNGYGDGCERPWRRHDPAYYDGGY